jgi:hypothetical protein
VAKLMQPTATPGGHLGVALEICIRQRPQSHVSVGHLLRAMVPSLPSNCRTGDGSGGERLRAGSSSISRQASRRKRSEGPAATHEKSARPASSLMNRILICNGRPWRSPVGEILRELGVRSAEPPQWGLCDAIVRCGQGDVLTV